MLDRTFEGSPIPTPRPNDAEIYHRMIEHHVPEAASLEIAERKWKSLPPARQDLLRSLAKRHFPGSLEDQEVAARITLEFENAEDQAELTAELYDIFALDTPAES